MTAERDVQGSMFPDLVPARPQGWIMPSVFTGTNADLMKAVAPLYLAGSVLDVTFGDGKWWNRFQPEPFTAHDLYKLDGIDFTSLPEADASVDTVCFDPPYTISGGPSSERLGPEFQERYGIGLDRLGLTCTTTGTATMEALILAGLDEALRVARRFVLVKCMEFAQGQHVPARNSFHDIPHVVTVRALERGWFKHDQIVHHTGAGPGGHNIFTPVRARRHHSYLLVFRSPDASP